MRGFLHNGRMGELRRILRFTVVAAFVAMPALSEEWNKRLAADYLDLRQKEWFEWRSAKAPGGPCVSCHTGLTYLLARPALRRALNESGRTAYETGLLDGLRARVGKTEAKEIFPAFGKEPLASQQMGVEAILSSLLLTLENSGSAESTLAFERLWRLQLSEGKDRGAWAWFDLDLNPWEMPDSKFFGATVAALATGSTTAEYRGRPEVRDHVAALTAYLQREQESQSLHNRLMLLWASGKLPEALPAAMGRKLVDEVWRKQQPDGGWTMESLGPWKDHPAAPASVGSNSYATGLTAFVLQKAGVPRTDARLVRALDWLSSHQDRGQGSWPASSMNKKFEPGSMQIQFMNDAATAFAALALLAGQ